MTPVPERGARGHLWLYCNEGLQESDPVSKVTGAALEPRGNLLE